MGLAQQLEVERRRVTEVAQRADNTDQQLQAAAEANVEMEKERNLYLFQQLQATTKQTEDLQRDYGDRQRTMYPDDLHRHDRPYDVPDQNDKEKL